MEKTPLPSWSQKPRRPISTRLAPERLWQLSAGSSGQPRLGRHGTARESRACAVWHAAVSLRRLQSAVRGAEELPGAGLEPSAARGAGELSRAAEQGHGWWAGRPAVFTAHV